MVVVKGKFSRCLKPAGAIDDPKVRWGVTDLGAVDGPRRATIGACAAVFALVALGAISSCSSRQRQPGVVEALGPNPPPRAKLRAPPGFDQSSQEARAVFRHRREEVRRTLMDAAAARAHLSVIEARIEREKDAD